MSNVRPSLGLARAPRTVLGLVLVGMLGLAGARAAESGVAYQEALSTWWASTSQLKIEQTAYDAKGIRVRDGLCTWNFDEGVLFPVQSGEPPVSKRYVGFVFLGKGTLSVELPKRSDAERFANHLVRRMDKDPAWAAKIADREIPYEVPIDRGLVLSADPLIERLLYDRQPVGDGQVLSDDPDVDGRIVVTADRNRFVGQVAAYDLLPDRRLFYERSGIDVTVALRQDRLLHEELGIPGEELRSFAEFRTDDRFRVVTTHGKVAGLDEPDRWLSCVRDGAGMMDTGFRAMAFAHGSDQNEDHHFQNFAGENFRGTTTSPPLPPRSWEPVDAKTDLNVVPLKMGSYRQPTVTSTVTLRARGGPLRHLAMQLPSGGAVEDSYNIVSLTGPDGKELPWVWLNADRYARPGSKGTTLASASQPASTTAATSGTSSSGTGGLSAPTTSSRAPFVMDQTPATGGDTSSGTPAMAENTAGAAGPGDNTDEDSSELLVKHTPVLQEIFVVLPKAVAAGETFTFKLTWKAKWLYANWTEGGQTLGAGTGPQPYLPELLPAFGGTLWNFHTTVTMPMPRLRAAGVALTGKTTAERKDAELGSRVVEVDGIGVRRPTIALGEWSELDDPAGVPTVRVHLFPDYDTSLPDFPPEIRRVAAWLDRLLPSFPSSEIDVYQGTDAFAASVVESGLGDSLPGLAGVSVVRTDSNAAKVDESYPHLVQTTLARQVAAQYWGHSVRPATGRDGWIPAALAEMYASFYIRTVYGVEDYTKQMNALRATVEDPASISESYRLAADLDRPLSLTASTRLTDQSAKVRASYATFILAETLRFQIGDDALFAGLDKLAADRKDQPLTTEQLQLALEAASGTKLQDFFDMWVHGGYLPKLHLSYSSPSPDKLTGCVQSDIPFGSFVVPVAVYDRAGARQRLVPLVVKDGVGRFEVDGLSGEVRAEIDPSRVVLATERKESRRVCPV